MKVEYGNDKSNNLKKKKVIDKNTFKADLKMVEKTPYIMDETMYYHSMLKGCYNCNS